MTIQLLPIRKIDVPPYICLPPGLHLGSKASGKMPRNWIWANSQGQDNSKSGVLDLFGDKYTDAYGHEMCKMAKTG